MDDICTIISDLYAGFDSTIANVAIPTIAGNLGASNSQGTWVITSFGVANAISIPITGWLAKRVGEVKLFFGQPGYSP